MNLKTTLFLVAALGASGHALANDDGKQLYVNFGCFQCHGDDARSTAKGGKPLAGMSVNDLFEKTRKMISGHSHADVVAGCGSQPNVSEIQKISKYIAALPK